MRFSSVSQALALMVTVRTVAADVIENVVVETVQVQVTVTANSSPLPTPDLREFDWRQHQPAPGGPTTLQTTIAPPVTSATPEESTPAYTPPPASTTASIVAASTDSSSSNMNNPIASAILNSTNFFRSQYEASPVTWNDSLASYAQNWASGCYFKHSGGPSGENIAAAWPTLTATDGVDMWGDEESMYNWVTATFSEATGHFTQLVWQDTTSVGCALASCHNTDTSNGGINNGDFLVCEYYPAGNVMGSFKENVRKAGLSERGVPGLGERSENAAGKSLPLSWSMAALVAVGMVGAVAL